jgi:pimeloyl-ACP methyl ester carboxylesterase
MDRHDGQVTLRDGRVLAYAEYGDHAGAPAFYFHGTPGCRLEGKLMDDAARDASIRLIALDRPGYGRSSFKRGRRIEDWPGDITQLADNLNIGQFAVIGTSGGGPHAQACAARMPERVTSATIISGAGSREAVLDRRTGLRRLGAKIGLWIAPLLGWLFAMWVAFWAPRLRPWMVPRSIDRRVMQRPGVRESFAAEVKEALRQGGKAMAQDLALLSRPWRFTPAEVGATRVFLWHGDADTIVPVAIGRYDARTIPGCEATFVPGGGHLVCVEQAGPILAQIASAAKT